MAARPPLSPSPQARRQAQVLALRAALAARDRHAIQRLLDQWVHRQGVNSLAVLNEELAAAEPEAWAWWQALQSQVQEPVLEEAPPRLEPQLPRATRPAPAPSHPAVVQLRAWLPDQELRRAA